MDLLVLMYHRSRAGRHGNAPEVLDAHFAHIAGRYANVLPGDELHAGTLNVCLSFDDAYCDFHAVVFPLLKKHRLRALLAVPPHFIADVAARPVADRLNLATEAAFSDPTHAGFCTWSELREMVTSGSVQIAAHGFSHVRLDTHRTSLGQEIDQPETILSTRLGRPVDSFVFPFGRYSPAALTRARGRYRHVFRIGGAMNRGWSSRVLYRVDADAMKTPTSLFASSRLAAYRVRYWWNRLRSR